MAPAVELVPPYATDALPARLVRADAVAGQGTKRTADPRQTVDRVVAARMADTVALAQPVPVSQRPVSSADRALDERLSVFTHGVELPATMSGLLAAFGFLVHGGDVSTQHAQAQLWVRERHPVAWDCDLFADAFRYQCWLALRLWCSSDWPAVFSARTSGDGLDIANLQQVLESRASQAVLVCLTPQSRLRAWKGVPLAGVPVTLTPIAPPMPWLAS